MYGKIMSISDEMMWRYYELLTDVQMAEIERLQRQARPMQAKKDLAARIVRDFHSADAAQKAGEDWARQFQKGEIPESIEEVTVPSAEVLVSPQEQDAGALPRQARRLRVDKLLKEAGLAASRTEAERKIREGAVTIDGTPVNSPNFELATHDGLLVRVGKRVKRIRLAS